MPGATYNILLKNATAANDQFGGGDVNVPGIDQMPAEIRAGFASLQRDIANRVPPLNAMFKSMGIEFSMKSMLKQSQIFTSYVGTIFQLMGALVDVMLAPFLPLLLPVVRWLGSKLPAVAAWMQEKVGQLIETLRPIYDKLKNIFADGWKGGITTITEMLHGWLDRHYLGFVTPITDKLGDLLGDNPGWLAVGAAIGGAFALKAIPMLAKKLVFALPKLAITLTWGGMKALSRSITPIVPGVRNVAGRPTPIKGPIGSADDLIMNQQIRRTGGVIGGPGEGINPRRVLSKLKDIKGSVQDMAKGWRRIGGQRVNIFTATGLRALSLLSMAGQIAAVVGGAYSIGKEYFKDSEQRTADFKALERGEIDTSDLLGPGTMSALKYAEGATQMGLGFNKLNPYAMLTLLAANTAIAGMSGANQIELNRRLQMLDPSKLVDAGYMQSWASGLHLGVERAGVTNIPIGDQLRMEGKSPSWMESYASLNTFAPSMGGFPTYSPNLTPMTAQPYGGGSVGRDMVILNVTVNDQMQQWMVPWINAIPELKKFEDAGAGVEVDALAVGNR